MWEPKEEKERTTILFPMMATYPSKLLLMRSAGKNLQSPRRDVFWLAKTPSSYVGFLALPRKRQPQAIMRNKRRYVIDYRVFISF